MQRADAEAMTLERPEDDTDILLAVAEDDGVLDVHLAHQLAQCLALRGRIVGRLLQALHDGGGGGGRRGDFDAFGSVEEVVGETLDFGRHGRREEEGLPREGKELADALDVGNEAHIEHPVGFVDHEDLDAVQKELAALEMIEEAAWRRDHHVGAAIELAVLLLVRHAADQKRDGELVALAEELKGVGHLGRQLAGRLQDQRPRHAGPGAAAFEPRQHRQHEGCRLAGPGLGDAEHVTAGDRDRDRLGLNWGRDLEACRGDGRLNFGAQAKIRKAHALAKHRVGQNLTRIFFLLAQIFAATIRGLCARHHRSITAL